MRSLGHPTLQFWGGPRVEQPAAPGAQSGSPCVASRSSKPGPRPRAQNHPRAGLFRVGSVRASRALRSRTTPAPVLGFLDRGRRAGTPWSMPSTLMSSSTSGQCTPCPPPVRRKLALCRDVASESRQDQASGTLITRPSARLAMISFAVTRTSRIRGSPVNSAAVLMPCLQHCRPARRDDPPNHIELARPEAVTSGKAEGLESHRDRRGLRGFAVSRTQ